ncbi:MAG: phosphate signaling complex protein PhoU [Anaerolineae bacterium]|nr:phosphate signaling complex protein PhoU [Anaerolineae bacterium]
MARETLDRKIRHLLDEILVLDSMVESSTNEAVDALNRRDLKLAKKVYDFDKRINARRFELENDVIVTIATQQPIMAGDLRMAASLFEVVGELERMGDYAKGIAKICMLIGEQPHIKPPAGITKMGELVVDMLHRAINAFVNLDVDTARAIPFEDAQVDALYYQVYQELIGVIMENPAATEQANYLMWASHNLERMADRVTNICERTIYSVTGKLEELNGSDDEQLNLAG